MTEDPAERRSLQSLDERIRRARGSAAGEGPPQGAPSSSALLGMAWRLAVELVVAPAVCGYVGWLLDYWLGTRPWLFVLFLLLGLVTGGVLAYRAMQEMIRRGELMDDEVASNGTKPGKHDDAGEKRE
ncbi:MAG: AtpZ/AtpI family protein [Alphaproteobacteria bacterium]|nr:AtpZ/AtpI family protein [Alphaproteobacteria bacterium]